MATAPNLAPAMRLPPGPPPRSVLARELLSFLSARWAAEFAPPVPLPVEGRGRPVMVLPGFLASDRTTARLRRSLAAAGFRVSGWGLGRNNGVTADLLDRVDDQVLAFGRGEPVSLVGWSLGGLIAREYAKFASDRVERVITLGSPFSGDLRANHVWGLYERIAGHPVDRPPLAIDLPVKPGVPTIACWSPRDGVVGCRSASGHEHERDRALQFDCTHMAFVSDPRVIRAVAALISEA